MNYPNWFKKTGYNNSLSQKNRDGGYNVKNLIAKHALATRYEFDQLFINDLIAIYELHGRDSVTKKLEELMSNVLSAIDLHSADIQHEANRKYYSEWAVKLELFMENKPDEVDGGEEDDINPEEWYSTYRPKSYAEFLKNNPKPTF